MRSCSRPSVSIHDHFGDRRRLAQQLQVLDAALLERVAVGVGARQRGPAELVLDVEDVLLDPVGSAAAPSRPAAPSRCALALPPREVDADRAAGDQHAADQRDDQQRVLGEQPPAPGHSTIRSTSVRLFVPVVDACMNPHLDSFRTPFAAATVPPRLGAQDHPSILSVAARTSRMLPRPRTHRPSPRQMTSGPSLPTRRSGQPPPAHPSPWPRPIRRAGCAPSRECPVAEPPRPSTSGSRPLAPIREFRAEARFRP